MEMNLVRLFELGMDRKLPDPKSKSSGLKLNVGAGNKKIPGTTPLDLPGWDADLQPIPYGDRTVEEIYAFHFLEHVREPVKLLLEFQRVLVPSGIANIVVPYYNAQCQAQDLDHKSVFCEETWNNLFNNPYYNKNRIEWEFDVGLNVIMGIKERNLALITQLVKRIS